ncbi:hypothetical protein L7F22_009232 [Adiantum nelumboides]|jgi:Ras-related GTP-binding protein A/B|nr:hypothetical protein [Adiantum nelumboides]
MKKKILLMGRSGSGKTSMRALVFSAYRAADTDRLGQTLDVEHSHVRFLGNLVLNLWDCGGQQSYMDNYLDSQRHQVFSAVGVLIYVFDLVGEDSEEWDKDVRSYKECLSALQDNSPDAHVFCLLHKMDLVDASRRRSVYASRVEELRKKSEGTQINCFATSIWDETIYKAWSKIIHTLIPNVADLERRLDHFAQVNGAKEVVIFERTTFLVISKSTARLNDLSKSEQERQKEIKMEEEGYPPADSNAAIAIDESGLYPGRFGKISQLIKGLRLACSKLQSQFQAIEMRTNAFSAYLDILTPNTYIMVITADPKIELSAIKLNTQLVRDHFEHLPALNISGR